MLISPLRGIQRERRRRDQGFIGEPEPPGPVGKAVTIVEQEIDDDIYEAVVFEDGVGKNWNKGNPTRLTATETGKYLVAASAELEEGNSNIKSLQIVFNGADPENRQNLYGTLHTLVPFDMVSSTVIDMNVDDYVELEIFQNSGNSKKLKATSFSCIFTLIRIA